MFIFVWEALLVVHFRSELNLQRNTILKFGPGLANYGKFPQLLHVSFLYLSSVVSAEKTPIISIGYLNEVTVKRNFTNAFAQYL